MIMELEKLKRSLLERTPGLMDATGQYSVLVPLVEGEGGLSPVSYTHLTLPTIA